MSEPIYERVWDAFTEHLHHAHYHDPDASATPATEDQMSLESTIEADFAEVAAKVREFGETKLPAALADTKKLAGNPVVDALLSAVHMPAEALTMAVTVINQLEELYKPESVSQAPVQADPAMGTPPAVAADPQPVTA